MILANNSHFTAERNLDDTIDINPSDEAKKGLDNTKKPEDINDVSLPDSIEHPETTENENVPRNVTKDENCVKLDNVDTMNQFSRRHTKTLRKSGKQFDNIIVLRNSTGDENEDGFEDLLQDEPCPEGKQALNKIEDILELKYFSLK